MFLIFISRFIYANTIIGVVLDNKTNKAVPYAYVQILSLNKQKNTDKKGNFIFENIPEGNYELQISRIGYKQKEIEIKVPVKKKINIFLEPESRKISGLLVSETRAEVRKTPITFSNIEQTTIKEKSYGEDIPIIVDELPNVYSYSESGSGLGYSYMKIRGFDQTRIGVMINGIPLNDPEDHQVYWVDMPDLAESTDNIQLQRGVGSSIYGVSTFGGSLNLKTNTFNLKQGFESYLQLGSYETRKLGAKFRHNLTPNQRLNLRFSLLNSDGYRDNTASELWSFFSNYSLKTNRSMYSVNFYTGKEITHAGWYASSESELDNNHQHNPVNYENEIDDFEQPHFEFHSRHFIRDNLDIKNSLFYIYGKGYYQQYKQSEDLWEYGLSQNPDSLYSDIIRQKWIEKNQYGIVSNLNWKYQKSELTLGTYLSYFDSDHWGEVDSVGMDLNNYSKNFKYHNYLGEKQYITFFVNENFQLTPKINIMTNIYYQNISYKLEQKEAGNYTGAFLNQFTVDYDFLSPRFGINYNLNPKVNLYANISTSQREPTDRQLYDTWQGPDDLGVQPLFAEADTVYNDNGNIKKVKWEKPLVEAEKLVDYEFGVNYLTDIFKARLNLFLLDFNNEIVPYGGEDDDGYPIKGNAESSIHRGIELSLEHELPMNIFLNTNVSYNDNYYEKFIMHTDTTTKDLSGNTIAGFPDIIANLKLSYRTEPLIFTAKWKHIGKQYLDNTENENRIIESYDVFNINLIHKLKQISNKYDIELSLKINNIFDKKYETAGYYDRWSNENYYYPAAERNIIGGIRIKY